MTYKTRVVNPRRKTAKKSPKKNTTSMAKKKVTKKKVTKASVRAAIARKKASKKKVAKKKVVRKKRPIERAAARGKRGDRSKSSAMYGKKKSAKKVTKTSVRKAISRKKASKKKTSSSAASRAPSRAELLARLKALQGTCGAMLKQLQQQPKMEAPQRLRMSQDLKSAVKSNSACRLATKRWGGSAASCNVKFPVVKRYSGPKGAKQMGQWSKKTKWTKAPSMNDKKFWGE